MTAIPRRSVPDMLAVLDTEFAEFVSSFCGGRYALWIGSGVSRDVVPGVDDLLKKVLEFVRSRIDGGDTNCPFAKALGDIFDIGGVPVATRGALDLTVPVETWAEFDDIVGRLRNHYSSVLNVQVGTHAPDYLVWEAVDAPGTYGDPALIPDAEHLCIALLMMEGVVRSAPTTNWDGLVEAAMTKLTGNAARHLRVEVLPEDLRDPDGRPELIKFHGCAVLAATDETTYRPRLVGRSLQITGWTSRNENQLMMKRLSDLFTTRDALFVGLSIQDANIQAFFNQGIENLNRSWPHTPPAVVFAEERLASNHKLVLQVAYGEVGFSAHKVEIEASALLGGFAKPVLVALVLVVFVEKVCVWIEAALHSLLDAGDVERVRADLRLLRDHVGSLADADQRGFIEAFAGLISFALTVFRSGNAPDPSAMNYQPLSPFPATETYLNPDFPAPAFGRFGIALSLLGRGHAERRWGLIPGSPTSPSNGVVRVETARSVSKVFVVSDSRALSELDVGGVIDLHDPDLVMVLAQAPQVPATRSPHSVYGRTGRRTYRRVEVEELCATVGTADELFEAFRLKAAL